MKVFTISKNGIKEIRRKMALGFIVMILIIGVFVTTISIVNSKQKENDLNIIPIIIPIVLSVFGFRFYRLLMKQIALLESYTLIITNSLITRKQLNTTTVSIYFNEIKEIVKNKNESFTIRGKEPVDLIVVPIQIDDNKQLEIFLNEIKLIVIQEKVSLLEKYPILTIFITFALMLCVYTLNNKIVVALTGTSLVTLLVWNFMKIRTNKNVDSKTKQNVWMIFIVLASVILVMVFKLTRFMEIKS